MRHFCFIFLLVFCFFCSEFPAQPHPTHITLPSVDSLSGFDENMIRSQLSAKGVKGKESDGYLALLKREYLFKKYFTVNSPAVSQTPKASGLSAPAVFKKTISSQNPIVQSVSCLNWDFENIPVGTYTTANAIPDWTISSQTVSSCVTSSVWSAGSSEFSVVATPVIGLPVIGALAHSPLGGQHVLRLNDAVSNYYVTKIARTITVTPSNYQFQFAYAGYWFDGGHNCCEQSKFSLNFYNNGLLLSCFSGSLNSSETGCTNTFPSSSYDTAQLVRWSNWKVETIDLSALIGQVLDVEMSCFDCIFGGHYGTLFFDSRCSADVYQQWSNPVNSVSYCGSSQAILSGPPGCSSYSWVPMNGAAAISAAQSTLSSITVSNVPGALYYCYITFNNNPCLYYTSSTLTPNSTQVNVAYIGASSSCSMGSSGSATVIGNGSSIGYTYSWLNSANIVVSTSSIASNLPPGIYSLLLAAPNAPSCGVATATTLVQTSGVQLSYSIQPYCSTQAFLSGGSGTNFQWYNGTTLIPANQGGAAATYTVTSPVNNSVYWLTYTNFQSCKDSVQFLVIASNNGSISINSSSVCPGANNGVALITLTPAYFSPAFTHSFLVHAIGGSTPSYSNGINPTASNSFTASNLSANGAYSVEAFDGSCLYTTSFTLSSVIPPFDFTINPGTATLCPGDSFSASAVFANPTSAAQYSYLWSPVTFLASNTNTTQNTVITPSAALGSSINVFYSLAVTPTSVNCPLIKTLSLTVVHFQTPSISAVPALCTSSIPYTISTQPSGGYFSTGMSNSPIGSLSGIISPSLANLGLNSFTYALMSGSCIAASSSTYIVNQGPVLVAESGFTICSGENITLNVSGADTYVWNTGATGSMVVVAPSGSVVYSVTGTSTLNNCSTTQTVQVNVDPCLGVNALKEASALLNIYPNPSSGKINIESSAIVEVFIYNEIGQVILKQNLNAGVHLIDLSPYASGIYFIKTNSSTQPNVFRLIREE